MAGVRIGVLGGSGLYDMPDLGDVEIRYKGNRVARWPVVSRVDRLPEEANAPTVLRQGDELLVSGRGAPFSAVARVAER